MAIAKRFQNSEKFLGTDGRYYMKIYSKTLNGLEQLYWVVGSTSKIKTKDDILKSLYKTYSKEQWDMKCKELNYNV
jgi:hypothetical protein